MAEIIHRNSQLAKEIAEATHIPVDRIDHFVILVQHDAGVAMMHTLCCEKHAREGLARIAATQPDIPDCGPFTGSN